MKIQGIEENIYIELKLLNLKLEKSLFESFIPFELAINIREEKYEEIEINYEEIEKSQKWLIKY